MSLVEDDSSSSEQEHEAPPTSGTPEAPLPSSADSERKSPHEPLRENGASDCSTGGGLSTSTATTTTTTTSAPTTAFPPHITATRETDMEATARIMKNHLPAQAAPDLSQCPAVTALLSAGQSVIEDCARTFERSLDAREGSDPSYLQTAVKNLGVREYGTNMRLDIPYTELDSLQYLLRQYQDRASRDPPPQTRPQPHNGTHPSKKPPHSQPNGQAEQKTPHMSKSLSRAMEAARAIAERMRRSQN